MVMKDCLEKNVQKKVLIEKHREYYLVLDEETGAIFLVNETSHFLYENCENIIKRGRKVKIFVAKYTITGYSISKIVFCKWRKIC